MIDMTFDCKFEQEKYKILLRIDICVIKICFTGAFFSLVRNYCTPLYSNRTPYSFAFRNVYTVFESISFEFQSIWKYCFRFSNYSNLRVQFYRYC